MSSFLDFQIDELEARIQFGDRLQTVSNKIHATEQLDEIMLDLARDICDLFHCDRMTLYVADADGKTIHSKITTGIRSSKDLVLPINKQNIAGYVALTKHSVSIADVQDRAELAQIDPDLAFCDKVDQITGYHTTQMLAAPILQANECLLGVIQLINNRSDGAFASFAQEGLDDLCAVLAVAYVKRMKGGTPTALAQPKIPLDEAKLRRDFAKELQKLSNKIHATKRIDDIMLDLAPQICALFHCSRLTLYAVSEDCKTIYSKIKTGIRSSKDLTLPISRQSIAGNVALSKTGVRIKNVYDENELNQLHRGLVFCRKIDELTGFTSRQMIALPIIDRERGALLGVIQLINDHTGGEFSTFDEEGLQDLCEALAIAFAQRMYAPPPKSKYDGLIVDGVLSSAEFEMATGWARRHQMTLEEVLIKEFHLTHAALGRALSSYFGVPYAAFRADLRKPCELLGAHPRWHFDQLEWLPLEKDNVGLSLLCLDPKQAERSGKVREMYPYGQLLFRVTTQHEFYQTLDHFFGADTQ